ncbi:hypothetical protein BKG80_18150 [Mycobacteroides chelonae]|uniref:O-methyltransferase n=2 Tax=Mycobacteriaceae TaxID=1762 RepID=UPI0008AA06BF|nr:O-methyltransferase [Mycobacteroides abscessus]MBF9351913.1 hypothetical protein [Mycobacteroides chelonae]OHU35904.1 hypothetical protein BKG80_18150 [Mycobacteroides chelonae]OHU44047.1 hypothetical protein BKG79_06425 [Mycobacteroides chelonae]
MSKPSYQAIDYRLRPAKAVERKMLADLFRALDRASSLKHYQYIGFGSPYFSDFNLFHRALDIQSMISIERELGDQERFEFNRPFAAVDLRFGESSEILPEIEWHQKAIVWLDYDDPLELSMLDDIALCVRNVPSGSIVLATASAQPNPEIGERVDELRDRLDTYIHPGTDASQLGGWNLADLYRRIIDEKISEAIRDRNTLRGSKLPVRYEQLINFQYADGAKMTTVGGIVLDEADQISYRVCAFDKYEFYRSESNSYRINIPKLTPKEIRHLDSFLPCDDTLDATSIGIPLNQSAKYRALYRYFPRYVDADL